MKLAGEFEFLGDAYRGEPEFDAPPPKGVVKLFYLDRDAPEEAKDGETSERCGFFKCPWWRWGAFKEAATRLQPDRAARGIYPNATIVAVPNRAQSDGQRKQQTGGR
jgi:hypothetical protein